MEKARVYELAKELNTTSKRLMEKLAEINIVVKNHMSLLEPEELDALYKHIGIIKHDESKKTDDKEKKAVTEALHKVEPKKEGKKDTKSAPRIIRTTEVRIDTKEEMKEPVRQEAPGNGFKGDVRGNVRTNPRQDFVRRETSNSGLRPGFVRDVQPNYRQAAVPVVNNEVRNPKQEPVKEVKVESKVEQKAEQKVEMNTETRVEPKTEPKTELNTESRTEAVKELETVNKTEEAVEIVQESEKKSKTAATHNEEEEIKKDEEQAAESKAVQEATKPNTAAPFVQNRPQSRTNEGMRNDPRRNDQFKNTNDRSYGNSHRQSDERSSNDRPTSGGNFRGQGDRPTGGDNVRGQGDRPTSGGNFRGQGDRPAGGNNFKGQGDRPTGGGNFRGQGDRPAGGSNFRGQGDRPTGGNNFRGQGDRPAGGGNFRGQGDRPYGGGFKGPNDRPQGNNSANRQGRPSGDRPQQFPRQGQRPLEIPKPEMTVAQKEEANSQRSEIRREFQNKDVDKDVKREQRKDIPKGQTTEKSKRFKPQKVMLGEKKGVSEVLSEDFILQEFYGDDGVKKSKRVPRVKKAEVIRYIPPRAVLTQITIPETVTVKDLAEALKKTSTEVIKKLMGLGLMATLNQELDYDTAALIADEFGIKTEKAVVVNEEDILFDDSDEEDKSALVTRPPVVVVMGHVDHGKTSLLDAMRETNVTENEAGGITQHIGAYTVKINNRNITFLDTPGHEAFTAMRARGAQVTDIAILVVAADDGVMPQTIEAINHAKAANVSIIVAINKIDKPGANPDRVKQELTEYGIVAEEWGGDAIMVPVSAKKRTNIDQLLEMILLAADMLELKANPNRQAKGTVIEAKLDTNRGPIATVLVQRGTLNVGDSIVSGTTVGRIRAMADEKGHSVKNAGPSVPVEILGLPDVPEAGEIFYAITDEKIAKQLAEKRKLKLREQHLKSSAKVSLEDLFNQIKAGKVKDLNIIVKADVQGSVEAVKQSLTKLDNDEVRINIVHGGVGAITEYDVTLAAVSSAIIIGFNVRPSKNVIDAADNAGVDIRLYRVIYNAIEDIKAAMKGMLEPTYKEVVQGHTEIRQIFKVSGVGTIGGCYVTDGKITRNSDVRVVRDGIVVCEGKLASLKRFKDDAKEVNQGYECGLSIERFNDIKEGDVVESFIMEEVAR